MAPAMAIPADLIEATEMAQILALLEAGINEPSEADKQRVKPRAQEIYARLKLWWNRGELGAWRREKDGRVMLSLSETEAKWNRIEPLKPKRSGD